MGHRQSFYVRTAAAVMLAAASGCSPSLEVVNGPAVLATATSTERYSGQIAVAGDNVIYISYQSPITTNGTVRRVSTSGGKEETIASSQGDIEELASDGTTAFWLIREPTTFNRTIRSAPVAGGTVSTLASGIPGVADVTNKCFLTDGGYLYFSSAGHGIRRMAVTGGTITDLAPTAAAESCTLSNGFVYFKDQSTFYRVPVTGGTPQSLATGVSAGPGVEILVNGGNVYGLDYAVLYSFPITGGGITPMVQGLIGARDLAGTSLFLYFNNIYTENLVRVDLTSGYASAFYTGVSVGVALDATHVYWIASGYQVTRGVQ